MPTTPCFEYEEDLHPQMAAALGDPAVQAVASLVASDLDLLPALSELLRADSPPVQGTLSGLFRASRGGRLRTDEAALAHLVDQVYATDDPDELNARRGAILELVVLAIVKARADVIASGAHVVHNAHNIALRPGRHRVSGYSVDIAVCVPSEQRVEFYGCQLRAHNVSSQELIDLEDLCDAFLSDGRSVAGVFCTLDRARALREQIRVRFSYYPRVQLYSADTLQDLRTPPQATRSDS